jgi:processive 1,2-diacylglycerol beta-glucosyltransferase
VRTTIVDAYRYAAKVFSGIVSAGYIQMVKTIPQMYRYAYERAERATEAGPFRRWAHQHTAANLRPLLLRERPDVVVCTHAFPCGAMSAYKETYADAPAVMGIVTDFAVHAFWAHANVDAYIVPADGFARDLAARGVPADRIVASGIPVHPRFRVREPARRVIRDELGIPPDRTAVLVMGGGLGIGPIVRILHALRDLRDSVCAVAIVGRNARLERRLLHLADGVGYPLRVLRFVENVHEYMRACDMLVTKPGGMTCAEALVAGIPTIIFKPLPGQEERNTRFLVGGGAALRAASVRDLVSLVQALGSDPSLGDRLAARMRDIARPFAADDAANAIENLARSRRSREVVAR